MSTDNNPPRAKDADREARRARREAESARRDAEAVERARVDARIDAAAAAAPPVLPGDVGETLAAVLAAMKPFRAADGYLSISSVGRSSDEVVALAEAILAVPLVPNPLDGADDLPAAVRIQLRDRRDVVAVLREYGHTADEQHVAASVRAALRGQADPMSAETPARDLLLACDTCGTWQEFATHEARWQWGYEHRRELGADHVFRYEAKAPRPEHDGPRAAARATTTEENRTDG